MEKLANIPVEQIVPPYALLRLIDKTSLDYLEMRDSIQAHGFLCSLCVRPSYRQPGKFEVIAGLHRFCCALDLELKEVPCIIKEGADDRELLECQVEENAIHHETRPAEYAARLKMFFVDNPELTMEELSTRLHKGPKWIKQMLKLNYLSNEAKKQLDMDKIPLGSAHLLAKLPYRVQDDLLPKAAEMPVKIFIQYIREFLKSFRESMKQGKMVKYLSQVDMGVVYDHLRTLNQIKTEYNNLQDAPKILAGLENLDPLQIWKMALAWTLHLDPISVQKKKDTAIKRQQRKARKFAARPDLMKPKPQGR
jgi:ParB/RepB/Spo0J family partition protein